MPKPVLYYFPGAKKYHFSHVALGVDTHAELAPAGYLSFGVGKGKATSPSPVKIKTHKGETYDSEMHIDFNMEKRLYKSAVPIELPECSQALLHKALRQFNDLDRKDYNLFTKNCANAVINFMKTIGYLPENEKFYPPVRPYTIAKRACEVALDVIQEKRVKIRDAEIPPLVKILSLLRNDIDRLYAQIKLDGITSPLFKNPDTKKNKIRALEKLVGLGEHAVTEANSESFEKFHTALLEARKLPSKAGRNVSECLYYFPETLLSARYLDKAKSKADVQFYKLERKSILDDRHLTGVAALKKLMENNINQLETQINYDKKTLRGRFKNVEKKREKIERLEIVLFHLDQPHVDYAACLKYLSRLMTDKTMKGKTSANLQQCLDRFPYEKLPQIEEMRKFLVKMDFLLLAEKHDKKGHTLFGTKKIPREIREIRALVPMDDKIDSLSDKEVYEHFSRINELLHHKIKPGKGPVNSALRAFYMDANLLASVVTMPATEPNTPVSRRLK